MNDVEKTLILASADILSAIEVINRSDARIALVVDENRRLVGSVTDGDVRRGLLRGVALSDAVSEVMNSQPRVIRNSEDRAQALQFMKQNVCRQVPVLDAEGHVIAIETVEEALLAMRRDNWVLLMAGGRGQRLRPLTDTSPKPMLMVGDKPILETILDNLIKQGFHNFYISLNYMGDVVRDYFGDGSRKGVTIRYIIEDQFMGTAGPLSLLPEPLTKPIIVMNGDILTTVDFNYLLDFHHDHRAEGTMCVCEYSVEVPFGVVELDEHRISRIVEKPTHRFMISAGIYALSPHAVAMVPTGQQSDMPTLFERLVAGRLETCVFPIREYWMDIGRLDDFDRANRDYAVQFPGQRS